MFPSLGLKMFLRNVAIYLRVYTQSQSRISSPSSSPPWEHKISQCDLFENWKCIYCKVQFILLFVLLLFIIIIVQKINLIKRRGSCCLFARFWFRFSTMRPDFMTGFPRFCLSPSREMLALYFKTGHGRFTAYPNSSFRMILYPT
jgi:hypothetical protein